MGRDPGVTSRQPLFMQRRSTDEYRPRHYSAHDRRVVRHITSDLAAASDLTRQPARALATGRVGTAIGLRALNDEWGATYYHVPPDAAADSRVADEVLSGPETVVDVQTHFLPPGVLPNGSPRDIGPVARLFPDLDFMVYHSGFEFPAGVGNAANVPAGIPGHEGEEGPYTDRLAGFGVNRLLRSLEEQGIGTHSNVYAELGTTWFSLIRRPREAAHVLGKLIACLGEDNVIWGTDSIWYGSAQPLIYAFRVFQLPDDMCEEFGYSKITPEARGKILGENAARVYHIDLPKMGEVARHDDLAWARQLVTQLRTEGFAFS